MMSILLNTREIQVKSTMRYHLPLVRMAIVKHSTKNQGWSGCGEMKTLLRGCWNANWEPPPWRQCVCMLSLILFNCQAPLSMGFSRQEYWSGLPCHSPGDLPHPGIEPGSLMFPILAGGFFTTSTTWEAHWRQRRGSLNNESGNEITVFLLT